MAEEVRIVKTQTLKVEMLQLASISMYMEYMFRIVEPVPMPWQKGLKVSIAATILSSFDPKKTVGDKAMETWNHVIFNTKNSTSPEIWNECSWLENITDVTLVQIDPFNRQPGDRMYLRDIENQQQRLKQYGIY